MSDFAFLERYAPPSAEDRMAEQRARWMNIKRECFAHNLKRALDYAEAALDHERDLRRAGHSTVKELKELLVMLSAFQVAAMAAQREQGVE